MWDLQKETNCKGARGNFLERWTFLYLNWGSGSTAVCVPRITKNACILLHVNYISVKTEGWKPGKKGHLKGNRALVQRGENRFV